MKIDEYQKKAHEFADYEKPLMTSNGETYVVPYVYPVLGLSEEAGEISGKFAKAIRDDFGKISTERKESIVKELGDVCWFVSELATLLNVSLEEVMIKNIEKLTSRKERGKIHGSGDNR